VRSTKLHLGNRETSAHASGPAVIVPNMTRHPLGVFYSLRNMDWPHSSSASTLVYDGRDVYTLIARKQGSEKVTAGGSSYVPSRFACRSSKRDGGLTLTASPFGSPQTLPSRPCKCLRSYPSGQFAGNLLRNLASPHFSQEGLAERDGEAEIGRA
jgi:hypothetical protein